LALIAFRIGYADVEVMEKEFGKTFTASALADLERYEAAVKFLEDGTNQEPFRTMAKRSRDSATSCSAARFDFQSAAASSCRAPSLRTS
jgi:hypothetical protein